MFCRASQLFTPLKARLDLKARLTYGKKGPDLLAALMLLTRSNRGDARIRRNTKHYLSSVSLEARGDERSWEVFPFVIQQRLNPTY